MSAFLKNYKARFEKIASRQLEVILDRAKKAARKGINQAAATFFTDLAFLISFDLSGPPPFLEPFGTGFWAPLATATVTRKSAHGIPPPAYFKDTGQLWSQIADLNPARVFGEPTARAPASVTFRMRGGGEFVISISMFPNLPPDAPDFEIAEMLEAAGVVRGVAKFMNLGRGDEDRAYRPLLGPLLREFVTVRAPRLVRQALEQEGFKVR